MPDDVMIQSNPLRAPCSTAEGVGNWHIRLTGFGERNRCWVRALPTDAQILQLMSNLYKDIISIPPRWGCVKTPLVR